LLHENGAVKSWFCQILEITIGNLLVAPSQEESKIFFKNVDG